MKRDVLPKKSIRHGKKRSRMLLVISNLNRSRQKLNRLTKLGQAEIIMPPCTSPDHCMLESALKEEALSPAQSSPQDQEDILPLDSSG